jgi:ribosomal protein L40E
MLVGGCAIAVVFLAVGSTTFAQQVRCDPNKVITAATCAKCHANEVAVWKNTPHSKTFQELTRNPMAKEICGKLGLRSVKRSDVCIKCHFTQTVVGERIKAVSGVSCESCHGAAADWVNVHSDYGGPNETRDTETPEHATERLTMSASLGMRNTKDLYAIASSCFNCHTVPDEKLVNTGGHNPGSLDFELVRWSQGMVRHNFLRDGRSNAVSSPERLRVMFVVGLIADLEYSTRATGNATAKSNYGITVATRAAKVATRLNDLQHKISNPNVQLALDAFAQAELRTNNKDALGQIADQIRNAGRLFATESDGAQLTEVDSLLPDPAEYK